MECGRTRTQRHIEHAKPLTINMVPPCDRPMRALAPPYVSPITPKEELDAEFTFNVGCTECMKKNIDCYRAEKGPACCTCQKSKRWCSHTGGKCGWSAPQPRTPAAPRAPSPPEAAHAQGSVSGTIAPSIPLAKRQTRCQSHPCHTWSDVHSGLTTQALTPALQPPAPQPPSPQAPAKGNRSESHVHRIHSH